MLSSGCVFTMLVNLVQLVFHTRTIADESALWNDAANMVLIVIPIIWPAYWNHRSRVIASVNLNKVFG